MQGLHANKMLLMTVLAVVMVLTGMKNGWAQTDPIRIVVLPFYVEDGNDAKDGGVATLHYRRMMRFINNQLVRHNFEVVNPFAHDAAEKEFNRIQEMSRDGSALAVLEVCKKYGVDAAYISWLKVKIRKTEDGYCQAKARLDGEGYDAAGHDLGAGVSKTFMMTRKSCDDAIAEVEKEVGDLVGRKLTAWSGRRPVPMVVVPTAPPAESVTVVAPSSVPAAPVSSGGILQRNIEKHQQYITIRLDQVTEYPLVEAFGKIVKSARGVIYAKNYNMQIKQDEPQASFVTWRATVADTDAFVLQANIMKMLGDLSDAGGTMEMKNIPYRYTPAEIDMLKGIRPGSSTAQMVQFVLDRSLVKDSEFAQDHDAYEAGKEKGFE